MSDIRVFNLKNKKDYKKNSITKKELQNIIEANAFNLLGVNVILSNVNLTDNPNEIVDTLGYDEDYRLVLIEYRCGKFGNTINKGFLYMDYIKENKGKIKTLLREYLDGEIVNNIILNPRLISLGDDFNKYDEYAIKKMPYDVDLIKYQIFDKDLIILEKNYHNYVQVRGLYSIDNEKIYDMIEEFVLSLGDEVSYSNINNCLSYRKIKNFMYLLEEEYLTVILKTKSGYKKYIVKNKNDLNKITGLIESAYDEN